MELSSFVFRFVDTTLSFEWNEEGAAHSFYCQCFAYLTQTTFFHDPRGVAAERSQKHGRTKEKQRTLPSRGSSEKNTTFGMELCHWCNHHDKRRLSVIHYLSIITSVTETREMEQPHHISLCILGLCFGVRKVRSADQRHHHSSSVIISGRCCYNHVSHQLAIRLRISCPLFF